MTVCPKEALDLFALTRDEVVGAVVGAGIRPAHGQALYRAVFREGVRTPLAVPDPRVRRLLACVRFPVARMTPVVEDGGVLKFGLELNDGNGIESVLIPSRGRNTLCISSQAGCRMGCVYCATGRMGLMRNLTAAEIVAQVLAARFDLKRPVDNIVFMGMGEPLDNVNAVAQAIRVITDSQGLAIACRHITVSTAGHADGIRALGMMGFPNLRLAISLNAADDTLRTRLMPINRLYPLRELRRAIESYPFGRRGTILVEYVLLSGVNDGREQARLLARFLAGLRVRVNVMAYNTVPGLPFASPSADQVRRFGDWLMGEGLFVRTRASRGTGIGAACGQLGAAIQVQERRNDASFSGTAGSVPVQ